MAPDEAVEHGSNASISMLAMVLEMRTRFLVAPVLSVLVTLPAGCGVVHAALGTRVSQVGGTGSPVEEPVARKVAGGAQGRPPPGRGQPAKQRTLRPVVARGTAKLEVGCGHLLSGTDRGAAALEGCNREDGIGKHAGLQTQVTVGHAQLDGKHALDAVFLRLHVARSELCVGCNAGDGA